ncbi:uncharacterized protein LOC134067204 isoform X3 [Sardina pilchardus]
MCSGRGQVDNSVVCIRRVNLGVKLCGQENLGLVSVHVVTSKWCTVCKSVARSIASSASTRVCSNTPTLAQLVIHTVNLHVACIIASNVSDSILVCSNTPTLAQLVIHTVNLHVACIRAGNVSDSTLVCSNTPTLAQLVIHTVNLHVACIIASNVSDSILVCSNT